MVRDALGADAGVYLDSSALAKLYVPDPESNTLEAFLKGRRDLMVSELAITEPRHESRGSPIGQAAPDF
jgi:hypothetical protein